MTRKKKESNPLDILVRFVKSNNQDGLLLCVILRKIRDEKPKAMQRALALLRADHRYRNQANRFGR